MTRADLVISLAALLAKRAITQAQAATLLDSFDNGDFLPSDLPPEPTRNDWPLALLLVLLLTGGNTTRPISAAKRRQARNTLRGGFQATMGQLAVGVTTGALAVGTWQSAMQVNIAAYTRQMAVAGAGALPSGAIQAAVEAQLAQQWPFLQTFTVQIAARKAGGGGAGSGGLPVAVASQAASVDEATAGMSAKEIAARGRLYGGTGWTAFWTASAAAVTVDGSYGWIVHFRARDDRGTCSPCSRAAANGPYAADGPYPIPGSEICDGAGNCRCELEFEYNPEKYADLTGRRAA